MERNPKEKFIKHFMNSIKIKTFIPRVFWYRCDINVEWNIEEN